MKKTGKLRLLIFLLLSLSAVVKSSAQSMNILQTNGNAQTYALTSASKIYFSNSSFILSNPSASILLTDIQKITFSGFSGINDVVAYQSQMIVIPNPASDFIRLKNISDEMCTVRIFSCTGEMVFSAKLHPSTEIINISHFSKGIYFVKVGSQTSKFIRL